MVENHPCANRENDSVICKSCVENAWSKKCYREELFIGIEETNIHKFVSPCCEGGISIEPLSRICCGICGKSIGIKEAVYNYDFNDLVQG